MYVKIDTKLASLTGSGNEIPYLVLLMSISYDILDSGRKKIVSNAV
jgi:hypothetical protein